jgi:alpha-tubulin suppressor-like RCC1 family protein
VSVAGTPVGRYATAEVGVDKSVSVSGLSLSGAQAGNYVLEAVSLLGTITAQNLTLKELTIQGLTVASRAYDGTTVATVLGTPTLVGVEAGDGVSLGGVPEASFQSATAGTGKPVTVGGYTLGGAQASKYRLTQPTLTGTIEAREVLVGGISAGSKVADGNRGARLNGAPVLLGVLGGDAVSVTGTAVGEFADAEAGSGKPVSVSGLSLGGAQAGNYRLATPALKASIWTAVAGDRVEVAYGWGSDATGQLGDGRSSDATSAVTVLAGARSAQDRWWQVSAGGGHSVGLGSDGKTYAWGGNGSGQLGDGTTSDRSRAVVVEVGQIPTGVVLQQVSAGASHTLALGSDGKVYAWGANEYGQLGDGSTTNRTSPVAVVSGEIPSGVTIAEVRAGREHSLALGSDGKVYAWGRNDFGQVGDGSTTNRTSPVAVRVGAARYRGIAAGRFHSLGVATDGKVWGWGSNGFGQLGDGTTEDQLEPVWSSGVSVGVKTVSAGWVHSAALGVDGKAYGWGGNNSGQLGDGTVAERLSAVGVVGLLGNLKAVEAGGQYTLGLGEDGVVYGWGANESGQLGDGTKVERRSPVTSVRGEIRAGLVVGSLSAGAQHALILANGEPVPGVPEVSLGSLTGTYGTPFNGRIEAAGRLIEEYGATGLPEGLVVDPATGVISGSPVQVGTFTVRVSARNSAGTGTGTLTVQLGKKELGLSGVAVVAREYDGTTVATLTGTPVLMGVASGDAISLGGRLVGQFSNADAGTGKSVSVSGQSITGAKAGNYLLPAVFSLTGDILPRAVSLSAAAAVSRDYDGTVEAGISGLNSWVGRIGGDDLVVEVLSARFPQATVGTGLPVEATFQLAGASAPNYRWIAPTGLRADIRPAPVVIQLGGTVRTYTGSAVPVVPVTVPPAVPVTLTYDGKTNLPVAAGTYALLARVESGNYSGTLSGSLQILPKTITGTVTVQSRRFDGTTLATIVSRTLEGVVPGDSVALQLTEARFTDPLLGTNKSLVPVGAVITGASAPNYQLGEVTVVPASILNNPPVFDAFPPLRVVESKTLQQSITATDNDLPRQTLVFRLLQAPTGVTITTEGSLQWSPRRTDIPGDYPIQIEVSDGIAAVQQRGTITVVASGADPVVIPLPDVSAVENVEIGGSMATPDPDLKGALTWTLIQGPTGFSVAASGRWSWRPGERLGGTVASVVAEATDGRLASRVFFRIPVTEDNQAPQWLETPPPVLNEGVPAAWSLAARDTDEPFQTLTFSLVSGPPGLTVSPAGLVSFTPTEAQGPGVQSVVVRVTDSGTPPLVTTNAFSVEVREVNQSPVLLAVPDQRAEVSKPLTVQFSAKDDDLPVQTLVFALVSGPRGMTVSASGLLQWTPAADQADASYPVEVSVADGVARVTTAFTVAVPRSPNTPPVLAEIPAREVSENGALDFNLVATDADVPAQTLTFSLVSGPDGLTVSPAGRVSFTPTEAQGPGTNRVVVRVTDSGTPQFSTTNAFTVVVSELNQPPVLSAVADQTVDALKPLTLALTATDVDLPVQQLVFGLVSGPAGLTVSESGLVQWTPSAVQGGIAHRIEVSVFDGTARVTAAFRVTVRPSNTPPVLADIPAREVSENGALDFNLVATDADVPAQTLTFSLVSGPVRAPTGWWCG